MQKVSAKLPSWDTTKTQSKKGFDKVWGWADKLGAPVNRLSNRIGSEAFWPTTLDKESDKAARILRSFCNGKLFFIARRHADSLCYYFVVNYATSWANQRHHPEDGFYTEEEVPTADSGPKQKQRVLKRIPEKVIQNAVGLAIFTTMRTGLWVSGAGGSGILVARKEDGSWSPPSGILLHTAGLGFLVGVDIYDCVLVINNRKALEAFTKIRATVGGEISAVAGPVGVGGVLENDGKWKQANRPVFTYLKSRGFYAGVQVDGTIIIERNDENARFYGETLGVTDILSGKARHPPPELRMLMETLKAAEGRTDVDANLMEELEGQPAPGDVNVDAPTDGKIFGIPEPDDPDPFGVMALRQEGLEILEAGTRSRPSSEQFDYTPSATSPIYSKFYRRSMDTTGAKSNRNSFTSATSPDKSRSVDRMYTTSEAGTQTEDPASLMTSSNSSFRQDERGHLKDTKIPEESTKVDYIETEVSPWSNDINAVSDQPNRSINNAPITPARIPPLLPPRNNARPPSSEFEELNIERR
ncbi:hypothetical protein G7046_g2940 [Stylonectria norvegica]|nr:hypothetical protein G7046_g2940 [Stylonectria norvegica]